MGKKASCQLLIFTRILTANGFLPSGSSSSIRHNTQIHISHKITHHAKKKTQYTMLHKNKGHNTQQCNAKNIKAILVAGFNGLRVCDKVQ
jgi:16S rRNA U516 pseudouridylate synthase RsuA-like enzyme